MKKKIKLTDSNLLNAMKWIIEQKMLNKLKSNLKLIDEAGIKFDLNPKNMEYLIRNIK